MSGYPAGADIPSAPWNRGDAEKDGLLACSNCGELFEPGDLYSPITRPDEPLCWDCLGQYFKAGRPPL